MSVEADIVSALRNDANVAAIVGTRIYPTMAPQDVALPYIVYQRISTPRIYSQSGASGLASPRVQLSLVSSGYATLRDLAAAVRSALDGQIGQAAFIADESDLWVDAADAFVCRIDIIIWHAD